MMINNEELSKILEEMNKTATPFRGDKYLRPEEALTAIFKVSNLKKQKDEK